MGVVKPSARLTADFMLLPPQSGEKPRPKGLYADRPGTGPEGETCGSCEHLVRKQMGKVYLKCGLMEGKWTGGGGTDVKARAAACSKWEKASP